MTDIPIPRRVPIEQFQPHVGRVLEAHCDPEHVPLVVVSVDPSLVASSFEHPAYNVLLRSAPDQLLMDGIYVLSAREFGSEPVFLSNCLAPRSGEPGYYYQVVFN